MLKLLFKNIIWGILLIFVLGNIYIFAFGIKLSNEVNHFEKEIKRLKQENLELEKTVYEIRSLKYAASMAAQFDFIKKSQPIYLDNLKYAFNR